MNDKLKKILEDKCDQIACKVLKEDGLGFDSCDTPQERGRVRAAWRNYLQKMGIQVRYVDWTYSNPSSLARPGMMCVGDFTLHKETAVYDIPNELAEKALVLGFMPEPEPTVRKKHEGPIVRAARNKTEYSVLASIGPSEDNKRLVFNFENGTNFSWCVFDFKFYHGDTGKEFGASHFKNIVWDEVVAGQTPVKPGQIGFFNILETKAKEGWAKNFFYILKKWIEKQLWSVGDSPTIRIGQQLNRLDTLLNKEIIAPVESLAKNNFVQKMNLEKLCDQVIVQGKVISFQKLKDDNLDAWFFQHVDEKVDAKFVRSESNYGYDRNGDIYADDDRREFILGNYMNHYRDFVRVGQGDLFRYVWDKFKFPMCMNNWTLRNFLENIKALNSLGYDNKHLMDYIFERLPYQGIDQHVSREIAEVNFILDYARMSVEMDREFEKYPRYLKTAHDIAQKNYKVNKSQILCTKYEAVSQNMKHLEYKNEKYCIFVAEKLSDIVREGTLLNHCIAQYIEGAIAGKYSILFLRENENKDKPLVTVHYQDGHVMQARGQSNRSVTEEEQKFLDDFENSVVKQKELIAA